MKKTLVKFFHICIGLSDKFIPQISFTAKVVKKTETDDQPCQQTTEFVNKINGNANQKTETDDQPCQQTTEFVNKINGNANQHNYASEQDKFGHHNNITINNNTIMVIDPHNYQGHHLTNNMQDTIKLIGASGQIVDTVS